MKVLILYTRLTGYWMSCMRYSRDHFSNEFLVIRSKPSEDAPFKIDTENGIEIINREHYNSKEIIKKADYFSPSLIYVAGWTNKTYLEIAKKHKNKKTPVVVGMDNHWKGTLRQYLAGIMSPWFIKPYFSDIWIPGRSQYKFAQKLGFKAEKIHKGLYCADTQLFQGKIKPNKNPEILFVGRLVGHKGVTELIQLINHLIETNELYLKFHFVGNGPLAKDIPNHNYIKHTPFLLPKDLPEVLNNTGFLILPSTYEAWGVVVHEALLSGTPVISTYQCGAAIDMLIHTKNGFLFDSNEFQQLELIFEQVEQLTDQDYKKMSEYALNSADQINRQKWSQTLEKIGKH